MSSILGEGVYLHTGPVQSGGGTQHSVTEGKAIYRVECIHTSSTGRKFFSRPKYVWYLRPVSVSAGGGAPHSRVLRWQNRRRDSVPFSNIYSLMDEERLSVLVSYLSGKGVSWMHVKGSQVPDPGPRASTLGTHNHRCRSGEGGLALSASAVSGGIAVEDEGRKAYHGGVDFDDLFLGIGHHEPRSSEFHGDFTG